ncbi:hypothetical protein KOR42_26190 [Thalassoglobus neptunius]|uniref:Glycosyltransferase RgtA/B/C/D-like domain-containing protein n=1 Tax=Thalassoglobus neptunius TaxID=1938619 RepID=A0A5C5WYY0_9PLAN|nr:hypothetical protein [Thalassoglobus neptunius]TWT55808.1 hypothetical protein KOR42_26190 [Thalassoglobus neptunius]
MDLLLPNFDVNQPTWFYLSLLLIVAVYFRFMRVFSLRNLDLALLLSASPGLLFVAAESDVTQTLGHVWLFVVACTFLVRMLVDPLLGRRPYLGQNLNTHGLAFLCFSVFAFLMTQAITSSLPRTTEVTIERAEKLVSRTATDPSEDAAQQVASGPATAVLATIALIFEDFGPPFLAILAHAAVISGLWFVGRNLFGDKSIGVAMATLYLLLPCTAYNVGEFNHVLPAALITWAFVAFRKPIVSGVLLGLACGTLVFPLFLLPIWAAFYGRKGAPKFVMALTGVAVVLLFSLALTSIDSESFFQKTIGTINVPLAVLSQSEFSSGFWKEANYVSPYRWPVMALYFIMVTLMTLFPGRRNVEVLLAQSAAAVIGTQLWYTQQGGVYLLWYVPLLLMVIFRPRLPHLQFTQDLDDEELSVSKSTVRSAHNASSTQPSRRLQLFR